ncbi:MAG: glycosyltransferase family 1 protein [bacterium]
MQKNNVPIPSTIKHRPLTIAIDVSQMAYSGTGVARYVSGLTKALLLSGSSHQFIFYAGALRQRSFFSKLSLTSPWNRAAWRILPLPPKIASSVLGSLPIPFEWLTGSADLLHSSDWVEPSSRLPMCTTIHDLVFHQYPSTVDPLIRRAQEGRLVRLTHNHTQIIADSESTKNDLMEIYNFAPSRLNVIYPGVESQYAPQSKKEIDRVKRKYNLPDQYILSLGTQEPRKNITRLIEAIEGLNFPLIIVGKYGWGEQTQSLGFVPEVDLPGLYSGATVFAYPSLYEGFGFPVIEAMACGAPVVTSNVSSLPEIAGDAAVLVDPEDISSIRAGIEEAISTRSKLIGLGLIQAQKFTWKHCAQQVLEVYDKIIGH